MPLLSRQDQPKPQRPARKRTQKVLPPIAIVENSVEVRLAGTMVVAMPEGALWIEAARALVVSDVHFEKGSAFAKGGQMLPPYDTHAALAKLEKLIDKHQPETLVSLGDSFHDGGGPARMAARDRALIGELMQRCDWVWVEGNHDGRAAETLGGAVRDVLILGPLVLRHEPTKAHAPGEIAGHLHPCAKVGGRGGSVRKRCFATDGHRLVMPAFGAYTGGLNVCDAAFAEVFPDGVTALVMGRDRVLPALASRLLED